MTVVAWDGQTLAADKRMSLGGIHATITKVFRLRSGALVSGCGPSAVIAEMRAWLDDGADPKTFPTAQRDAKECASMLVVLPGGVVHQYEYTAYPLVIENRQWAIGSGRDFAAMAMRLGKSAAEAVLLTAEMCHDCGNGVDSLALTEASSPEPGCARTNSARAAVARGRAVAGRAFTEGYCIGRLP